MTIVVAWVFGAALLSVSVSLRVAVLAFECGDGGGQRGMDLAAVGPWDHAGARWTLASALVGRAGESVGRRRVHGGLIHL